MDLCGKFYMEFLRGENIYVLRMGELVLIYVWEFESLFINKFYNNFDFLKCFF